MTHIYFALIVEGPHEIIVSIALIALFNIFDIQEADAMLLHEKLDKTLYFDHRLTITKIR